MELGGVSQKENIMRERERERETFHPFGLSVARNQVFFLFERVLNSGRVRAPLYVLAYHGHSLLCIFPTNWKNRGKREMQVKAKQSKKWIEKKKEEKNPGEGRAAS